jgi:two-component system OmpR family response regulator
VSILVHDRPVRVLFVEDDERLAQLTTRYLEGHGLDVLRAASGGDALAHARARSFDLVVLDLMLPGKDGLTVCRELRRLGDVPIVMLTARADEADRVLGLETGADDYVVKPFSSPELLARILAHVRRARGQLRSPERIIRVGQLSLEPALRRALMAGRELTLTSYEFALLQVLAERPGRPLSREQLIEMAGGNAEEAFDRSIDVHVSRLRQKLGDDAKRPRLLRTVRGVGYVLVASESEAP